MPSALGPSEGQAVIHQQEIVSFIEDGAVATDPIAPTALAPSHLDADDTLVNSVKSFLQRPILFETHLWNTTQVPLTEIANVRFPHFWLMNNMIREKLSGFRYLKCDFKVRIQVNAMPFQAGRLLMYFDPMHSQKTIAPSSTAHFGGITGYPHVELDLMNETSMELTLPYNNLLTHYDLVRGLGGCGSARLLVYSSLTGDAASTADISVWMWAENIDLQLPTGMPVAPVAPSDNAQAGDEEKKRPGNVETISRFVGSVARQLGEIPLLSAITAPISAVSDAVAGVASIFGWSKPQDPEFPMKAELGYSKYFANFNGDVKAKVLAMDARNQVEIPSYVSHTGEDEMSLSYLVQKFTFLGRFTWATTDLSDAIVFNVPNVPDYCVTNTVVWPVGTYDLNYIYNTMLSYLSGMFAFWRGSLRYKFKIVKSPFHTGRLRVDLVPGYAGVGDYVREKVYSQIIDIRETNEFEIEVPYKWNAPWKRLTIFPGADKYALTPTALFVRVLNPLRNGGQSAPHVEMLVEVAGGKDFQFAYPILKDGFRPMNGFPLSAQPDNAQSGEVISSPKPGFEANSLGIGEVVVSLRQVLKRYVGIPTQLTATDSDEHLTRVFGTAHNEADGLDITKPLVDAPVVDNAPDLFSYVSYLYRFWSGSMRVAAITGAVDDFTPVHYSITNPTLIPPENIFQDDNPPIEDVYTVPRNFQFKVNEPFIELQVPFYQLWPAILTDLGIPSVETSSGLTIGAFTTSPYNRGTILRTDLTDAEFQKMSLSRAIGEDFNFAFSVGPPVSILPTVKS